MFGAEANVRGMSEAMLGIVDREAYRRFKDNPNHPSLRFKQVHATQPIYAARVTRQPSTREHTRRASPPGCVRRRRPH
jgi:hypothetical protein